MFSSIPAVDIAEKTSLPVVLADRERFAPAFRIAEHLMQEKGIFLGGQAGLLTLKGEPLGISDYFYELFSASPRSDARAITDAIYRERIADKTAERASQGSLSQDSLSQYVSMVPQIPGKEYQIFVETRLLFHIKSLPEYRGGHIADVVSGVLRPSQFGTTERNSATRSSAAHSSVRIKCFGPDLQLIRIYRGLMDLMQEKQWPGLVEEERELRDMLVRTHSGKVGGDEPELSYNQILQAALKVASTGPRVIVGDIAVEARSSGGRDSPARSSGGRDSPARSEGRSSERSGGELDERELGGHGREHEQEREPGEQEQEHGQEQEQEQEQEHEHEQEHEIGEPEFVGGAARRKGAKERSAKVRGAKERSAKVRGAKERGAQRGRSRGKSERNVTHGRVRLQIVTQYQLQKEEKEFRDAIRDTLGAHLAGKLVVKYDNIMIPGERHIKRMTMYYIDPRSERRVPFMDIFNLANYSLISFEPMSARGERLKIGTPYTILFVLLIDLWTVQLLFRIGAAQKEVADRRTGELMQNIRMIGATVDELSSRHGSAPAISELPELFPPASESYIGFYEDPVLMERRALSDMRMKRGFRREFPYYPGVHDVLGGAEHGGAEHGGAERDKRDTRSTAAPSQPRKRAPRQRQARATRPPRAQGAREPRMHTP